MMSLSMMMRVTPLRKAQQRMEQLRNALPKKALLRKAKLKMVMWRTGP